MATFEYSVDGQSITTTKAGRLVSGTIGVNTVKFTFDSSWSGLEKWATFDPNPGKPYKQPLDANGECLIPGEVMGGITLRIGAFGLADGQAYPTVWANKLQMEEGCFIEVPVSDWPEPSPVIEEILEELENKVDKPEDATPGNVAIIGSNSNIEDSGVCKDNLLIAPQLASNNIKTDSIPYKYRQTGGGIGVGNREYDSIVGGSVVWNQLLRIMGNDRTQTVNDVTLTDNRDGSYTLNGTASANGAITFPNNSSYNVKVPIGHIFAVWGYKNAHGTPDDTNRFGFAGISIDKGAGGIWKNNTSYSSLSYRIDFAKGVAFNNVVIRPMAFDLTQMFGSAVAERLYAMEQASAGSGIAILKRMFPNAYYPYTATPSLESVSGLSSHQMKDGNGNVIAEYPLDDSLTLRGVAVIDDNNNIKFDGDEYAPDGTVTRRYGIVDLGTLTWVWWEAQSMFYAYLTGIDTTLATRYLNLCDKYVRADNITAWSDVQDKQYVRDGTNNIIHIRDSSYATGAELKTALSGHYLIYVIATATTETAEPYESLQICDPLGTEEYVTTGIVPVGHNTRYPENQVAKLDGLPSDFSRIIAPTEIEFKATRTYTVGRLMIIHNVLYKAKTSIAIGATLTVGTNIEETTLDEVIASL